MISAAFLDRDGVINRKAPEGAYVTRWEDLEFLPGVAAAIEAFNRARFRVIVVSNQRCVAKGLATRADVDRLHWRMCEALAAANAIIDAVYFCPHDESEACGCRKPAPGMLVTAAREHGIDLPSSWMIGDSQRDVDAGRNAGCRTVRIAGVGGAQLGLADLLAPSLSEACRLILQRSGGRAPVALA